jgi:hypothetical protein
MTPHVVRRAKQRATADKAAADREAARKIAMAVSLALRKAEQDKTAEVEALVNENAELQKRVATAERKVKA